MPIMSMFCVCCACASNANHHLAPISLDHPAHPSTPICEYLPRNTRAHRSQYPPTTTTPQNVRRELRKSRTHSPTNTPPSSRAPPPRSSAGHRRPAKTTTTHPPRRRSTGRHPKRNTFSPSTVRPLCNSLKRTNSQPLRRSICRPPIARSRNSGSSSTSRVAPHRS